MVIKTFEYAQFRAELYAHMIAVGRVDPMALNAWVYSQNQLELAAEWSQTNPVGAYPNPEELDLFLRQQYLKRQVTR